MEEMMREERLIVKPFEDFRLLEYHAFQEMNHHARAELTGSIPYVKKEEYIKAVRHKLWVQVIALSEGVESLIFYGLIEKNQENSGKYWFSFSTVYSSADGSGWYCMPEIGDRVRLYFPASQESKAYVASAYHEEGSSLRQHPERKFWRNKDGKEIQLSPERIVLTNNDGTYIELSDNDGIEIVSEGSVTIKAKENLHIRSQESSIELSAPKQIYLKQGNTEMNLGGNVSMQGAKIRL